MATLIGPADYPAIRATIRLDLDASDIPDEVIEIDAYAGEAEREVRDLDPNVDTYTGANLRRAKLAAVYLCSANLAAAFPNVTRENFDGSYSYAIAGFDPVARGAWLRWSAYEQLALNLGIQPLELIGAPAVFELASAGLPGQERGAFPTRGRDIGVGGVLGWW